MVTLFRKVLVVSLLMLLIVGVGATARTWEPFAFEGNESYRYQIQWGNGEGETAFYELRLRETEEGDYSVKYSTEARISPADLSSQLVYGFWGGYGPSLHFIFLNPMYEMLFQQLELRVGERMSYFGQGLMEVTGTENIAGRQGYVCKFYEGDELVAEWVIDPDLAMPLRSITYSGGEIEGQVDLVSYERI